MKNISLQNIQCNMRKIASAGISLVSTKTKIFLRIKYLELQSVSTEFTRRVFWSSADHLLILISVV